METAEKGKKPEKKEFEAESLIRILSTDIPGNKPIYAGLKRIKGVSWSFANAVCQKLKINKNKKIKDLDEKEIAKISEFIKNPQVPEFMLNRRQDRETGKNEHLTGADLEMKKEFDIKRMRKIKCYKGIRHSLGQPVRGQRTKAHFRKNKTVGVMKKAKK